MKASVNISLKPAIAMTPEIRLAIDILSMSAEDIEQLIKEELQKNPWLEEAERPIFHEASEFVPWEMALKRPIERCFRKELLSQTKEGPFNLMEVIIAENIINNLNNDGLLEDWKAIYELLCEELGVFFEWLESVRLRIMDLEPIGCAAKDSNEALTHQLKHAQFKHDGFLSLLYSIKENPKRKITNLDLIKLKADSFLFELKGLTARPSSHFESLHEYEKLPDVMVTAMQGSLEVALLFEPSKRAIINGNLLAQLKSKDSLFLKISHRRAVILLRSLLYRESSLLKVAKFIVDHQHDWFFCTGPLKPLNLSLVAESTGLHESSVSRLVSKKFLFCEKGMFSLKYFFGVAIRKSGEIEGVSATSIKEAIRDLIKKEEKSFPLTDQRIATALRNKGLMLSRRTVTKYRESLNIPASSRRRLQFFIDGL